jgi:hypothetical protein
MRRISKQSVTRDPTGRCIGSESEELTDDGEGNVQVNAQRTVVRCTGCRRLAADVTELRGLCDWCHVRGSCVDCASKCAACSRRLCGRCRRGFTGAAIVTVCPACQQRLLRRQQQQEQQVWLRQSLQDRLLIARLAFERDLARRHEQHQLQELRLKAQSAYWSAQLQAARLRLDAGLPLFPPKSWPRRIFAKVVGYAARLFR